MNNKQYKSLLALIMVSVKMNMQILACLLDEEKYKEWKKCFDKVERDFLNEVSKEK